VCSDYGNIQFEALVVRLLTEEASQHKRNDEDDIRAAFQALDTDKKGYLEQVLSLPRSLSLSPSLPRSLYLSLIFHLSLAHSLYHFLSIARSLSLFLISRSLSLLLALAVYVSLSLAGSLSLARAHSLSFFLFFVYFSSFFLSLFIALYPFHLLARTLSLSLWWTGQSWACLICVWRSVSISVSLPLFSHPSSLIHTRTHCWTTIIYFCGSSQLSHPGCRCLCWYLDIGFIRCCCPCAFKFMCVSVCAFAFRMSSDFFFNELRHFMTKYIHSRALHSSFEKDVG